MSDADGQLEHDDDPDAAEVLDPEQYNQNRRLKSIHTARDDVREALDNVTHHASSDEHYRSHSRLAEKVAFYGQELMPLIQKVGWDEELPDHVPHDTVQGWVTMMGQSSDRDNRYPSTQESMYVFSHLNQFAADVGLGADLDDDTDEWEV